MRLANKCDLCGSNTWCGRECRNAPQKFIKLDHDTVMGATKELVSKIAPEDNPFLAVKYKGYRDKEARRTYMRDYMRRRRG